jgi:hypothetical protein
MSEDKKVSLRFLHEMIRAGMGAISYSLQYSHSIDMISDSTYFQQILKDLFMCARSMGESDARTM